MSNAVSTPAPRAIIIAGPNGAGKTTFAREFLPAEGQCPTFINADLIAAGLSPFQPERMAIEASRLMLEHVRRAVDKRQSFAVETTLAGRAYLRMIRQWQKVGYHVELFFLQLPSADLAVERVKLRVAQGGHNIPEIDIRRRFQRGIQNFQGCYKPIVNTWQQYDAGLWPSMLLAKRRQFMTQTEMHHPDQAGSRHAMIRAARRAAELARQYHQPLALWRDGKVVKIMPDDLPPLPEENLDQQRKGHTDGF